MLEFGVGGAGCGGGGGRVSGWDCHRQPAASVMGDVAASFGEAGGRGSITERV